MSVKAMLLDRIGEIDIIEGYLKKNAFMAN